MYGTPDVFGHAIPEQVKVAGRTRDSALPLRGFETPGIEIRTHDPLASRKKRENTETPRLRSNARTARQRVRRKLREGEG